MMSEAPARRLPLTVVGWDERMIGSMRCGSSNAVGWRADLAGWLVERVSPAGGLALTLAAGQAKQAFDESGGAPT